MHTLTLMEAARPAPPTDFERQFGTDVVLPAVQRYRAGDKAGAVDIFFRGVFGPVYRAALDHGLPGAFDQAAADADAFFTQEMPAIQQWPFTEDDAHHIQQPALGRPRDGQPLRCSQNARSCCCTGCPTPSHSTCPGLTHLLHVQDPAAVADGLTGFFARHPIPQATLTGPGEKRQNELLHAASRQI